jgi:hypothetical protein
MSGIDFFQLGRFRFADVNRIPAAGMEVTARGRVSRVGYIPFQDDALGAQMRVWLGYGRQQGFRIGM